MSSPAAAPKRFTPGVLATVGLLAIVGAVAAVTSLVNRDLSRRGNLVNVSCRGAVGAHGEPIVSGFVIGAHAQRVVIRALGPSLAKPGEPPPLMEPRLRIVRNRDGAELARSDGWLGDANPLLQGELHAYAPRDPRDAACALRLDAGAYTALIESGDGRPGAAMLEIFVVPD